MNHSRWAFASAVCLFFAVSASAATHVVSNLTDFRSRIGAAVPGDTILLTDGTYSNSSAISIGRQGTASQPIVIAAQNVGGATISGSAGITFSSSAAYVEVRGFRFTHTASTSMPAGSHHCRLMRNVFNVNTPSGPN